jgi:hypothetical protein
MVAMLNAFLQRGWISLLAQVNSPAAKSIDPELRAKIVGQMILLTIGGVALVTLAWLALRIGRRYVQRSGDFDRWSSSADRADWEDWAKRSIEMGKDLDNNSGSESKDDR